MKPNGFMAQVAAIWSIATQAIEMRSTNFYWDRVGALNLSAPLIIVGTIIGAVVGLAILAALLPTYLGSAGDVVTTLDTATIGNTDADALFPVFSLLAAFAAIFAIVGLVLLVVKLRKSG